MHVARRGVGDRPWAALAAILVVMAASPARAEGTPVRLTIEITWRPGPAEVASQQSPSGTGATLELSEGVVVEAIPWPDLGASPPLIPPPNASGAWPLGHEGSGGARVRIEAPIDASITVRLGATGWTVPLLALLDGPQRSPEGGGANLEVRRLPWDALEVQTPGEGTAEPGAVVPVTVGFNVLAPEPTEVELTLSARLLPVRGDRPVWEDSRLLAVTTNPERAPARILPVPMPTEEGTYVLELSASWTPREPQGDASRLGRWWRRLRPVRSTDSTIRRVSLAVAGPAAGAPSVQPTRRQGPERGDVVVDSADMGRSRGLRPRTEGRSPADPSGIDAAWAVPTELLVDPPRRERSWDLLGRVASESRPLAPAGPDGLSWTAAPLKVARPDRPHRLELAVLGGDPSAMSVALIASGNRPRVLLDTRGSGPVVEGTAQPAILSWSIWPDAADPVLVIVNRSSDHSLRLGEAKVIELADGPAPLPLNGPPPDGGRTLAVRLTGPADLDRFGGTSDDGPDDPIARGQHLASYLGSIGASAVILPPARPDRPVRAALEGQAGEDPIGPDRDSALISVLKRRGIGAIVEVLVDGVALPGLPPPGSYEAQAEGLVRLDRSGSVGSGTPSYNLLRPEVQRALTRHVEAALGDPNMPDSTRPEGLLIRLGPGPTLPGRPDTGLDDVTYARFAAEAIKGEAVPGLDGADPLRFAARHEFVTGPASVPWLTWRSRRVGAYYMDLADALAERVPGIKLVIASPGLDDGPAGEEARRYDREGLPPDAAWRSLGLDLGDWPKGNGPSPILLRGVDSGIGDLERDLATHPALDAQLASRQTRGLLLGLDDRPARETPEADAGAPRSVTLVASSTAPGAEGDESLGHALAALDADWVAISAPALAGREDGLRRFAGVYRCLPRSGGEPIGPAAAGVVARSTRVGERTYAWLANDTPYAVRFTAVLAAPPTAAIDDLGRGLPVEAVPVAGGRRATLDLPPFGVAALRIGASDARLASASAAFEGRREAHRQAVTRRLQELASVGSIAHLSPGFEPESTVRRASSGDDSGEDLPGWSAEGAVGASVEIDTERPRSGRGSLRLTAPEAPAAASSPPFLPPGPVATLRASIRTEPPDAAVRIRIESDSDASEPVRLASDLPAVDRGDWAPLALRAPGLPEDGSMIRLRFELRTPGQLWVDDLSLNGPGLAQARSCLAAALQAYDEGRFADFARLARSHWVVEAGGPIVAEPVAPPLAPLAGEVSTDLPSRSRLR